MRSETFKPDGTESGNAWAALMRLDDHDEGLISLTAEEIAELRKTALYFTEETLHAYVQSKLLEYERWKPYSSLKTTAYAVSLVSQIVALIWYLLKSDISPPRVASVQFCLAIAFVLGAIVLLHAFYFYNKTVSYPAELITYSAGSRVQKAAIVMFTLPLIGLAIGWYFPAIDFYTRGYISAVFTPERVKETAPWVTVLIVSAVAAAGYAFRLYFRCLYGALEILVGLIVAFDRMREVDYQAPIGASLYYTILTASIYLMVRGADNVHQYFRKPPNASDYAVDAFRTWYNSSNGRRARLLRLLVQKSWKN